MAWTFTTAATAADVTAPALLTVAGLRRHRRRAQGRGDGEFQRADQGISASTVKFLKTSTGLSVGATVTYDAATRKLTITPSARLAAGTKYRASLTSGLRDLVGNRFAGTSWTFTTAP